MSLQQDLSSYEVARCSFFRLVQEEFTGWSRVLPGLLAVSAGRSRIRIGLTRVWGFSGRIASSSGSSLACPEWRRPVSDAAGYSRVSLARLGGTDLPRRSSSSRSSRAGHVSNRLVSDPAICAEFTSLPRWVLAGLGLHLLVSGHTGVRQAPTSRGGLGPAGSSMALHRIAASIVVSGLQYGALWWSARWIFRPEPPTAL